MISDLTLTPADRTPRLRRIAITLLALAVFRIGQWIAVLALFVTADVVFPGARTALLLAAVGLMILEANRPVTNRAPAPPLAHERFPVT